MPNLPVLRHRHAETEAVPVVLPHVVIVVTEPDTLTVTVDGTPHLPPDGESWGRSDFGAVLDEITGHRSISVRIEVIETDGSHFTDIIGAHRPRRPAPLSDTIEPADEKPQPSRVGGLLPGETVALAPVTTHLAANDTGTINLDPGSGGPVLVFGMSSGTTVMWEPA